MTSRKRSSSQQDAEDTQAKKSRVSYKGAPSKTDSNGDQYWEVSKMRRVTVSKFRGRTMVNVREYYEKDGQELPGKKGISLPVEQFAELVKLLPDIEKAVEQQGESLPRPEYFNNTAQGQAEGTDEEMDGKGEAPRSRISRLRVMRIVRRDVVVNASIYLCGWLGFQRPPFFAQFLL